MAKKQLLAGLALAAAMSGAQAITVLSEGFDNVGALAGAGWTQVNNSTAPLGTSWFQGNTGIFSASSGAASSYIAANYLGTGAATGAISNWLILPELTLDSTSIVSFMVRNGGDDFLDTIEVRFSSNGASADVGTTTASVGDFTQLLGTYSSSVASDWTSVSFNLAGLASPTTGRIAIRYLVDNVATNGNYLGIDNLTVTAVPEPASYLLMALGVAGLVLRRRISA